jgi:hypothetical protein
MGKIRFFYNGLKTESGKLEKAYFSYSTKSDGSKHVMCYKDSYDHFSETIRKELQAINKSDYQTDYVVHDHIEFNANSPYWIEALKMAKITIEKKIVRITKKIENPKTEKYLLSGLIRDVEYAKRESAEISALIGKAGK